jgi:hypothetical protein
MQNKRRTNWFIVWLSTQWENKAARYSNLLGAGVGLALGIFALARIGKSELKNGVWHLLSLGLDGLSWFILELPVNIIAFLFCRPERTYGCVDFYGIMYALFIGMPLLLAIWVILFGLLGAIVGGLTRFILNKIFSRMRR